MLWVDPFTPLRLLQVTRPCVVLSVAVVDGLLLCLLRGPWNYYWLFAVGCWVVLNLYWAWSARQTLPVLRPWSWLLWSVSIAEFLLYSLPLSSVPILGQRLGPRFTAVEAVGAGLCVLGATVAIWSRRVLARSWNYAPALRDGHVLVQHGPYAIIRHPIYLGFMLLTAGMVIVLPEVRALPLLPDIAAWIRKMRVEESILRSSYPIEYPEYERRVKRLLPYIW